MTVKVLDFGLAKAADPAGGSRADAMNSPTFTSPATQLGIVLGTAAYMAPEQATGKAVDKRVDIWAFGVVFWEMLTGHRLFDGDTVSETIAAMIKDDPRLNLLPADTSSAVRHLLARCLERDPKLRLRDIGEARILLSQRIDTPRAGDGIRTSRRGLWLSGEEVVGLHLPASSFPRPARGKATASGLSRWSPLAAPLAKAARSSQIPVR